MKFIRIKRLYISALALVFFIMVLLTYIALSTYHTLSSNKENAIATIENKGNAIFDVLLASFKEILDEKGFTETDKIPHNLIVLLIDNLIRDVRAKKIVGHLCIISETGSVNYHSGADYEIDIHGLLKGIEKKKENVYQYRKLGNGVSVYEIARRIPTFFREFQTVENPMNPTFDYIVLGMEMTAFEAARKADINHTIIMVGILTLLASGALFFLYIIRSYYHVNSELIESRDYIHSVVENMANGLISINRSGDIEACNRPAEMLLGLEKQTDKTPGNLGYILDLENTGITRTIFDGIPVKNKEIQYKKPDGQVNTILLNATPLMESTDTIKGAVVIINDLSEIKLLKEKIIRVENFAVIGKIAAVVAHEIRNPLSSIRGFANFFSKKLSEDEKSSEYAGIIIEEVDRINRVITDLLHFSKSETPDLKKTDLRELIEQTLSLIEYDIRSKDAGIINSVPEDLGPVNIDPDKMKQVFLNLLLNAIQIADGQIDIEIGADISENAFLHIWVEDNGPGIDVDEKKSVFEPFYSRREQGTGLGLSIVQKIVENHDGRITFDSPVIPHGKGTRFNITLPLIHR